MKIYLLRHGETAYNVQQRYQGAQDIPLSPKGRAELIRADLSPKKVYISPLCRAKETADVLFPDALKISVPGLREMAFGVFEGRNYREMEHDPVYRAWVEGNCEGEIPGGESKALFSSRTCAAFALLVERTLNAGESTLVIVAHAGTQMAVMERYALPHRPYFDWYSPNGGGFLLDASQWKTSHTLTLLNTVQYTEDRTQ